MKVLRWFTGTFNHHLGTLKAIHCYLTFGNRKYCPRKVLINSDTLIIKTTESGCSDECKILSRRCEKAQQVLNNSRKINMEDNFERYQCQIALPGFGISSQQLLENARVLIIGMGGLGCPSAQYLVSSRHRNNQVLQMMILYR